MIVGITLALLALRSFAIHCDPHKCSNAVPNLLEQPLQCNESNTFITIATFILDFVGLQKLTQPRIFIQEGVTTSLDKRRLIQTLSEKSVASVIRERNSEILPKVLRRSNIPATIVVVGEELYTVETLNKLMENKILNHRGRLLILCQNCDRDSLKESDSRDVLTDIWLGIPKQESSSSSRINVTLYEVVFSYSNRCFNSEMIGTWNLTDKFYFPKRRWRKKFHFENATISVLATNTVPYTSNYSDPAGKAPPKGYVGRVISLLSQILNFSFHITPTKFDSYGELVNGSFTAGIGEFLSKKLELAAGIYSVTPSRRKFMAFTTPIARGDMIFAAHLPETSTNQPWTAVVRTFSLQLWIAVIVIMSLSFLVLLVGFYSENGRLYESIPVLMAVSLMQGGDIIARSVSTKIIVLTACFFCWMLLCFYNAVLFSMLTLDTESLVSTLDELSNSEYQVGATTGSSSYEIIATSKSDVLMVLAKKLVTLGSTYAGIDKMCQTPKYAHLTGMALMFHYLRTYGYCPYYAVREVIYTDDFHLGAQPNGVIHKRLSHAITQLSERGLLVRLVTFYNLRTAQKSSTDVLETKDSVDLDELLGPFFVLSVGIAVSLATVGIEIVHDHLRQRRHATRLAAALNSSLDWKRLQEKRQVLRKRKRRLRSYHHSVGVTSDQLFEKNAT